MQLHIIPYDKYGREFIEFNNQMFPELKSIYFITYIQDGFIAPNYSSIVISEGHKILSSIQLFPLLLKADKIIHHGLFVPAHNIMLSLMIKNIKKKYYWVMWGGDLYYYLYDKNLSFKNKIHEFFRRILLKNIKYIITPVDIDFNNLRKWYSNKGKQIDIIPYTNLIYKKSNLIKSKIPNLKKRIMIGNSSTRTNNHVEIFNRIHSEIDFSNYEIIVPLSYGESTYRDEIVKLGIYLFEDSFVPLLDFLDLQSYENLLSSIDIAIFYNDRQQAMGNIISLISKSIPIYMKKNNPLWSFFIRKGFYIIDAQLRLDFDVSEETQNRLIENSNLSKAIFSLDNIYSGWETILRN